MAAITSAVIGAGAAIYGANKSAKATKQAAASATPTPYSVAGPAGSVDIYGRQIDLQQAANPFANMFNVLGAQGLANAGAAGGEIGDAYQGLFGQGLTDTIQSQYDLLSQIAAPGEQRARLGLDDQLFARGQLGTSGGAERFRALQEGLSMADLQRQQSAVGLGQGIAQNRFNSAMANQLQQFNVGTGAFGGLQQLFQNLLAQGNLGVGAASGTPQGIALANAQAQGAPYQAGFNFLNQSGAFDALGRGIGNLFGGGGMPPPVAQPDLGPINVTPGNWQAPTFNIPGL